MRILFLHPNFPAQYRHMATALAGVRGNQVVFGTARAEGELPHVLKAVFKPHRAPRHDTHPYIRPVETAVLNGQGVFRLAQALKARGFVPDVICAHSGWGVSLYAKDAFPAARLLSYFEWYYHASGSDADFLPGETTSDDDKLRIRTKNAPVLLDLAQCDRGLCPTGWQRQQFPEVFRERLSVLHDGIDTGFFAPKPGARLKLAGLDLAQVAELVTYVARGMEPYRGFPQFMAALAELQRRRPQLHGVIVGEDRVVYGRPLPDGRSFKQQALAEHRLDPARTHFTGPLPYGQYLQVIRASAAHVYLTVPFVLSWSMLEAMAAGCLIVGSDTSPVREVIEDGRNGLLTDFFDTGRIADRVEEALDHADRYAALRQAARETVIERYDLQRLLPRHLELIQSLAA
jgi:glycosyltransferase involved in cell wall biosynthesis